MQPRYMYSLRAPKLTYTNLERSLIHVGTLLLVLLPFSHPHTPLSRPPATLIPSAPPTITLPTHTLLVPIFGGRNLV